MTQLFDKQDLQDRLINAISKKDQVDAKRIEIDEMEEHQRRLQEVLAPQVNDLKVKIDKTEKTIEILKSIKQSCIQPEKSELNGNGVVGVACIIVAMVFIALLMVAKEMFAVGFIIIAIALVILVMILVVRKEKRKELEDEYKVIMESYDEKVASYENQLKEQEKILIDYKDQYTKKSNEYETQMLELDNKLYGQNAEVECLYSQATECMPNEIPEGYMTWEFARYLLSCLRDDLVDSMREAILLYKQNQAQFMIADNISAVKWEVRNMSREIKHVMLNNAREKDELRRELKQMSEEHERLQRESNRLMMQNLELQERMQEESERSRRDNEELQEKMLRESKESRQVIEKLQKDAEEFHKKFED